MCSYAVRHKGNDILVQLYFLPFLSCPFFSRCDNTLRVGNGRTFCSLCLSYRLFFCELGGLFSDQLVRTLIPIIVILMVVSPIGIFKYEKRAWLRRNPKHSRLFLPKYNKRVRNFGVSISKVDDITYGRGVSFSWFDGYFIAAGRHRVTFQFYEYRFLKYRAGHKIIYKKEMEFNFHPGAVYVIEVLPDIQTFRIVEDKTRFV